MRIYLVGFMGSGKTTSGKRLARALSCPFLDLDHAIEEEYKKSIPEIFKQYDEDVFRLLEKSMLRKVTEAHDSAVISTGGGTPCFFDNMDFILGNGLAIYLYLEVPVLVNRILHSHTQRPLVISKDVDELSQRVEQLFKQREAFYLRADLHFDARNLRTETMLHAIAETSRLRNYPASE